MSHKVATILPPFPVLILLNTRFQRQKNRDKVRRLAAETGDVAPHAARKREEGKLNNTLYLEEPFEPPHLEEALANEYHQLEDAPPLDARVCALSSIPVYALAHDDVALLVLDLGDKFRHCSHLLLQWVLGGFRFRDVDNAVHIERDLLRVRTPVLVVEAVCVFAVFFGVEGVVAGGHAAFVDLVASRGRLDPEIDLQVSAAAKLPVADLERDCHLVVLVEGLVEAFALVGLHLNIVRRRE